MLLKLVFDEETMLFTILENIFLKKNTYCNIKA